MRASGWRLQVLVHLHLLRDSGSRLHLSPLTPLRSRYPTTTTRPGPSRQRHARGRRQGLEQPLVHRVDELVLPHPFPLATVSRGLRIGHRPVAGFGLGHADGQLSAATVPASVIPLFSAGIRTRLVAGPSRCPAGWPALGLSLPREFVAVQDRPFISSAWIRDSIGVDNSASHSGT